MFSPIFNIGGGGDGGGAPGTIDSSIVVVDDSPGRNALAPHHEGQLLYQKDIQSYFTANGLGIGNWVGQFFLGGDAAGGKVVLYDGASPFFVVLLPSTPLEDNRVITIPDADGLITVT